MTMPYAHCKGILMGTLSMELGGKVTIDCEKTGYSTEIEFKLKVCPCLCDNMKMLFCITSLVLFFVIGDLIHFLLKAHFYDKRFSEK